MSCGYRRSRFGSLYKDVICIDGHLFCLDGFDEPEAYPLYSGGHIPCPACNTREHVEWLGPAVSGNSRQRRRRLRRLEAMIVSRVSEGGAA